jgi:hypothetical protein
MFYVFIGDLAGRMPGGAGVELKTIGLAAKSSRMIT